MKLQEVSSDKYRHLLGEDSCALLEIVGDSKFWEIVQTFGGCTLYIPQKDRIERTVRDEQIRTEFKAGASIRELAQKYYLTTVTIRRIVNSK